MTVLEGAVDTTFAAFGIDAVYTPAGTTQNGFMTLFSAPATRLALRQSDGGQLHRLMDLPWRA